MESYSSYNFISILGKSLKISLWPLVILAAIFASQLRVSLLVIYPLLTLVVISYLRLNFRKSFFNFFLFLIFALVISWRNGFYWKYNLVSLYYVIPFLMLLFSRPARTNHPSNELAIFIFWLTGFAIINDVFGLFQYFTNPDDDSFRGIYGKFTVTQNGLALLNSVLFFFYLQIFLIGKKKSDMVLAGIFICSAVLGFYGAGMVALLAAVTLYYVRFSIKSIFRIILITGLLIGVVTLLMNTISPKTLDYNVNIFKKFLSPSGPGAPRKLLIGYHYVEAYASNPLDLAFGSGPGTFNSRAAFMVGSPYYFSGYPIKSEDQPYYFKTYAFSKWNPSVVTRYDGFASQPFSSMLAIFGEYGILFGLLLFYSIYRMYKRVQTSYVRNPIRGAEPIAARMYRFLLIFMFLLIAIDNYIEYPEVVGLMLILIKLAEMNLDLSKKP